MSNVSVEYLVLRDNVEYSRLTAFKGGGAAISVTADAAVKWALSGKFAQNRAVNYLTDVIQPVLTIDGVRQPLGKYIPTDAYTEHDGMRPVVSLTAYDLTYLAMSSKIETRLHLAKGTLYTAAIQALLVESGITDFFVEANTATLQADREDWEPGTDRLTIINALAAEINYNSIWMDGGGTVHCSAFRMPSADAISVTYRDGEYSIQHPEWSETVDMFDHPNVFIVEVDNPDGGSCPMRSWTTLHLRRSCRRMRTTSGLKACSPRRPVRFTPAPAGGTLFLTWWSWCGMVRARCTKRQAGGWSWNSRTK